MNPIRLENYTPHAIAFYDAKGTLISTLLPNPTGPMRLVEDRDGLTPRVDARYPVPLVPPAHYTGVDNAPPTPGKSVIVSAVVAQHLSTHNANHFAAILAPDTGPGGVVRDAQGRIVGTTRLIAYK